jgi:hypothetical protein
MVQLAVDTLPGYRAGWKQTGSAARLPELLDWSALGLGPEMHLELREALIRQQRRTWMETLFE